MPSRDRILALSNLKAGLNRFQSDAGRNHYIDGYDVLNEGGDLRRRDAFRSIASGAPHMYPEGCVRVVTTCDPFGAANLQTHNDRNPNLASLTPSGSSTTLTHLYVGNILTSPRCKFSGVDFQVITADLNPARHYLLVPEYFDGDLWVPMPSWIDETRDAVTNLSDDEFLVPLARAGRVFWHLDQFADHWETTTINSIAALWVRLVVRQLTDQVAHQTLGTGIAVDSAHSIDAPGIRIFSLPPVNGLFSVRVANRSSLIIGSDRQVRMAEGSTAEEAPPGSDASVLELGAQLGCKTEDALSTQIMHLLDDEGVGVYGVQSWARPTRDGTNIGTAGLTYGTAGNIKKTREQVPDGNTGTMVNYQWIDQQHRGALLARNLAELTLNVNTALFSSTQLRPVDGLTHVRIRCTTSAGGGVPLSEEVSGWAHGNTGAFHSFFVYPPWSAAPVGGDRFEVYAPHARVLLDGQGNYEIQRNQEHTLELAVRPYAEAPSMISPTTPLYWRIGRELRWICPAGDVWSGALDPVTGLFVCTNGRTPIMEFDGQCIRRLEADFESAVALNIAGEAPDSGHADTPQRAIAKSQLRQSPPIGSFVAFHRQRLFIAGGADPLRIFWSEAAGANNVWPLLNEDIVRDAQADPIRGLISFNDRLIIWTVSALHEAVDVAQAPFFAFQQVARTIGFVGPNAACIVTGRNGSTELVGIAPDGIYAYASGEPSIVVDQWTRYINGGVNGDMLHIASAIFAPQASAAYFALPPRGSSTCTRILRWDVLRNAFDVWRVWFGVRTLAVDTDELGRERILVGTDTGLVMTLSSGNTDDGEEINGYALSPFVQASDGADVALVGALVEAKTTGAGAEQQMTFDLHVNGNVRSPIEQQLVSPYAGEPQFGTDSATLGDVIPRAKSFPTFETRAQEETRGNSFAYRVGGACRWILRSVQLRVLKGAARGRGL